MMKRTWLGKAAFLLGAWVVYVLAFTLVYPSVGAPAAALAMLPVIAMGRLLGVWAGLLSGLLAFPLNVLLVTLAGGAGWDVMARGGLMGSALVVLVGITVGRTRDLSERVKRELAEHGRTEQELQRRNRELTVLNAVTQALSGSLELQDLLDEVLSPTTLALGFTGGLIGLAEEQTGNLALSSYVGLPQSLIAHLEAYGMSGTLCDFVYREEQPLGLEDMREGAPVDVRGLLKLGLQSYIGTPIVHKDRVLGTLCLFDTAPHPAHESNYALLTAIGQQIGVAVENSRLFERITREREVAQTLLDTAGALSTTLQPDTLLERVLDELQRVVPYDTASISLLHDDRCRIVASRGLERVPSDKKECALDELPLAQRVARGREPVIVPDVQDEPNWALVEGLGPVRSWLGVPLIFKDEVTGVLMVDSHRPGAYDEGAARLASAFAQQTALAMENARLYGQTRAQLREATLLHGVTAALSSTLDADQILPYVARSLCEALNGTSVEIYSLDEESGAFTIVAEYATPQSAESESNWDLGRTYSLADFPATAEALARRRPTQVQADDPDADPRERAELEAYGARAMLLLPMVARDRVLGFAEVWESQGPRRFSPGEVALGQTLVSQAATALENARLFEEARERTRRTELLLSASETAASTLDRAEVLRRVARAVTKAVGADMAGAYLLNESGTALQPFAGYHVPRERAEAYFQFHIPLEGHPFVEQAWRSHRPVFSADVQNDPRFDAQTREMFPAVSALLIPMIVKDEIIGGLWTVWWEETHRFAEEELRLVEGIVRQAAAAIENARLFEETRQRAAQAALTYEVGQRVSSELDLDELLSAIVTAVYEAFDYYGVMLMLLDEQAAYLTLQSIAGGYAAVFPEDLGLAVGEGMIGNAAATGETQVSGDVSHDPHYVRKAEEKTRSELAVPIKSGREVIGVLDMQSNEFDAFDEISIATMEALSAQIATAIENARLYEETQRRATELGVLYNVAAAGATSLHLDEILQHSLDVLQESLEPDDTAILLVEPETGELVIRAWTGFPGGPKLMRRQIGVGIPGWVVQAGEPVLSADVSQDERFHACDANTCSELCVPLRVGGQVIGALNLESHRLAAFSENDMRLVSTLAGNLAMLIERARLFEEIEAARAELQQRAEALEEANVRLQELDRLKSQFLAHMSHELRTPLNGILGYAQILKRDPHLTDRQREGVNIIQHSGEHLLSLINDVLDLSKIEAGKMELQRADFGLPVFLKNVADIIRVRAEQKGIAFVYHPFDFARDEPLPPHPSRLPQAVRGDESRLFQVLVNLLGNGVKFTEQGSVTLKVGYAPPLPIGRADLPTEKLRFQVEDTGIGIAPEQIDAIFEPFLQVRDRRRQVEGTGLGLTISRKLVQLMGGELQVKSTPGEGSAFWFDVDLPEAPDWAERDVQAEERTIVGFAGEKRRALVVDDRPENRAMLVAMLAPLGFETIEAADGRDGLEQARRAQPDVILVDLVMPVLDGLEMARRIRQSSSLKDTVIIAVSASALKNDQQESLAAGCDGFIPKPVQIERLLGQLERHLHLEWVYAERQDAEKPAKALPPAPLVPPSPEEVAALYDLAMMGDVGEIRARAAQLQALDERLAPFAAELHRLAQGFQVDPICKFLEPYLS